MNKKPSIAHITYHNCSRVTKETLALEKVGYTVELISHYSTYGFNMHNGGCAIYDNEDTLRKYLKESKADIFHVHNMPDFLCQIAIEEKGNRPVVWDIHDLVSLVDDEHKVTELETYLFKNVDAIVHVSEPIMEFANKIHHYTKPQTVLYPYCLERYILKESIIPMPNSVVYEGGIRILGAGNLEASHRDLLPIGSAFSKNGLEFHAYSGSKILFFICTRKHKAAGINVYQAIPDYAELIKEISKYAWGFVGSQVKKDLMDCCMPNKLFEYICAGVPVVVYNADFVSQFVEKYGLGITLKNLSGVEISKLKDIELHKKCKQSVMEKQMEFTMESHIYKIEELYKQIWKGGE